MFLRDHDGNISRAYLQGFSLTLGYKRPQNKQTNKQNSTIK